MIKVEKVGDDYILRDSNGIEYGRSKNKDIAEGLAADWNSYYEEALA